MRQSKSMRWEEAKGARRPSVGWEREFEGQISRYSPEVVDLGPGRVESPYDWRPPEVGETDRRVVVFLSSEGNLDVTRYRKWYDPTTVPDLLPRFVRLDFSQDSEIARFYQDFGRLGVPDRDKLRPFNYEDWRGLGGEPVWWLRHKARELHALMEIYYALRRRDTRRLRKLLGPVYMHEDYWPMPSPDEWIEDYMFRAGAGLPPSDSEWYPSPPRSRAPRGIILIPCKRGGRLSTLTARRCLYWASYLVSTWVNWHLESVRRVVGIPQPEFWQRERAKRAARPFVPKWYCSRLLDALYVHFYDIITGNGELRRCLGCGDLYPVPVVQRGRPKVYCTRRCQNAANKRAQRSSGAAGRKSPRSR